MSGGKYCAAKRSCQALMSAQVVWVLHCISDALQTHASMCSWQDTVVRTQVNKALLYKVLLCLFGHRLCQGVDMHGRSCHQSLAFWA
ncbi:TPA: hypothetical protein ACH3X3_002787 [Trebouxia sp. C0006]